MSARLSFVSIFLNKSRGQKCHCGGKNLTGRICAYFLPSVPILPFPTPHIWGPAASHLPLVLPATRASFLTRGGGLLLHHSHSSQVLTEPLSPPHLFIKPTRGNASNVSQLATRPVDARSPPGHSQPAKRPGSGEGSDLSPRWERGGFCS